MKRLLLRGGLVLILGTFAASQPIWLAAASSADSSVQLPDPQVLAQAIVQGQLAAVETYAAMYRPDLNQAIPIRADLSLRPLSLALTHLRYGERSQMSAFTPLAKERDMIQLLLKLNATPNYHEPDLGQATPLHLVFDLPNEDQVDLLELFFQFQGEASLVAYDAQERSPLVLAQQKKSPIAPWLAKYTPSGLLDYQIRYAPFALASGQQALSKLAQQQALIKALKRGQVDQIADLLETQSPDVYSIAGQPLLHQIVREQRADVLELWLQADANFDLPDLAGQSALHLASSQGLVSMIEALLAAGATLNLRNPDRNTALHLAVRDRQPESARVLLKHRARWDLPNLAGQTPWQLVQTLWQQDPAAYGELYLIFQAYTSKESSDVHH